MATVRKLNVLILDDDPTITALVRQYLHTDFIAELALYTLNDPHAAKTWLSEKTCDIVLSDIEMPGCDGMRILKHAKERNAWTQVIFMTAHSSWDRIAGAIEHGAADYLLKPIRREELAEVIRCQIQRLTRWREAVTGTLRQLREPTAV